MSYINTALLVVVPVDLEAACILFSGGLVQPYRVVAAALGVH